MNQANVQLYSTELVQVFFDPVFCPRLKIRQIFLNRSVRSKKRAALAKAEGNLKFFGSFGDLHNALCNMHKTGALKFPYTRIKWEKVV